VRRSLVAASLGIALLAFAVFAPVLDFDFVNYDDLEFVVENPHVSTGLSADNIRWAFANAYGATGGPLTWLSHMIDAEMFGLDAGAHHRTSLVLHTCNSLLLFALLWTMTHATGRSAWVAALFAVHPLHVESVAWVAERKDVLSTLFWWLTIWAYVIYVRRPRIGRYLAVVIFFVLGLMSKPMVATLPFVLLLLDVWPLERLRVSGRRGKAQTLQPGTLILEKIPLVLLAFGSIALTFVAQRRAGAVAVFENLPLGTRLSNAAVSYLAYIGKMFWPADLAAFYPYRQSAPLVLVAGCVLVLVAITAAAVWSVRRAPYVTVGWLWYAGTLVPVIGIVQLGSHAMADRFTYIPLVGLFIAAAWGGTALLKRAGASRATVMIVASSIVVAFAVVARGQVHHWQNGVALWEHATRVTHDNARAHANLGVALAKAGQRGRAIVEYAEALRIDPRYAEAHNNLGLALGDDGRRDEAVAHFQEAIRLNAAYPNAHTNLANLLDEQGKTDEAISHYREAIRLKPDDVLARVNLAVALARAARVEEAVTELQAVLRLDPTNAPARKMLEEIKGSRVPRF
jgi:protein O-mannosyl-transferase